MNIKRLKSLELVNYQEQTAKTCFVSIIYDSSLSRILIKLKNYSSASNRASYWPVSRILFSFSQWSCFPSFQMTREGLREFDSVFIHAKGHVRDKMLIWMSELAACCLLRGLTGRLGEWQKGWELPAFTTLFFQLKNGSVTLWNVLALFSHYWVEAESHGKWNEEIDSIFVDGPYILNVLYLANSQGFFVFGKAQYSTNYFVLFDHNATTTVNARPQWMP